VEVTAQGLVRAQRHARDADQAVRPRRGDDLRGAELAPVVGEPLDVGHLVCFVRFPQALEPSLAPLGIGGRAAE
jgi:hypothetical protein